MKDLSLLSEGRDIKDIIIVDNKVESYSVNLEHGIPIKSYMGEPDDDHLMLLKKYLLKLKDCDDVRPGIRRDFFEIYKVD